MTARLHGTGKAVKGKRDQYTIATKFAAVMKDGQLAFDCSPEHVKEACEASLQRLGTETIDLYYMHRYEF